MGTKIYRESYLPGYQYPSARNTKEIPTNSNWSLFFGNKTIQNRQNFNGILPGTVTSFLSGYEKDALKQTMLMHEAAFKHQVSELHRLYKVQKEIMSETKRKDLYKHSIPIETSPSSSSLLHIAPYEDALMRWHKPCEPNKPQFPKIDSNDCEVLESRPSKARKRLFDLHLPADKYIDVEDEKTVVEDNIGDILSISGSRNNKADLGIGATLDSKIQIFDLNEPIPDDDVDNILTTNLLQKSDSGKDQIIYMNDTEHTEPRLDSNVGVNTTTFSKLLSDEILKATVSCKNKEMNTRGDENSSHITHSIGSSFGPTFSHNKIGNKIRLIDINSVCKVDAEVSDKENEKIATDFGAYIDLNMCASEDEITLLPSCDESDTLAAMAIVAMSSLEENMDNPSEDSLEEALLWFSEAISKSNSKTVSDEIDEFEAMTMRLTELKEDEYMPRPLVLENTELESETETIHLPIRARRGKAKRQKRDFQREILPGMISLSRHEVAEDVQAFSGIMKAMGSPWPILAKRNGIGGRGRRRLVEPKVNFKPLIERINSVEIGWGKTPRRPRRRRCQTGNLSSIASL